MDVIVHVLSAANKGFVLCKHCWHFLSIWTLHLARCGETSVWLGELCAFRALAPAGYVKSFLSRGSTPSSWKRSFSVAILCEVVWTDDGRKQQRASWYWCVKLKHIYTESYYLFLLTDTLWMMSVHVERANLAVRWMIWALRPCKHSDCLLTLAE